MNRVLIIEDNRGIAATVREHLVAEGYQAEVASTAAEGLAKMRAVAPDLVILDLMLPDHPGESVLLTMRAEGLPSPVLILSAKSDEMSKVRGFRAGADDYLTKPFGILELLARVDNLVRRSRGGVFAREVIRFGSVDVYPAGRRVTVEGAEVELRPKEYELLLALLSRPGQVWPRRELLNAVWGYNPNVESRTVDWHISELRRKLERDPAAPRHVQTVRKVGYRLDCAAE
ncbi:MAG: response regulator transcription factor [Gemmatimonadales bacterium]|nr:response regulator transcription factor [Gemmatimonadales bacterium]